MTTNLWPLGIILYLIISATYSFQKWMTSVNDQESRPYGRRMFLDYIGIVISCFCWGMQSVS